MYPGWNDHDVPAVYRGDAVPDEPESGPAPAEPDLADVVIVEGVYLDFRKH